MKSSSPLRVLSYATLLFGLGIFIIPAHAQNTGVKVQPAIIEEKIEPGKTVVRSFNITNESGVSQELYIVIKDIESATESGQPIFSETSVPSYGAKEWLSAAPGPITLRPGETKEVALTIAIPENAQPGGHFASIFASAQPGEVTGIGTGVGFQVGSIVSIRIAGPITEDVQLREFRTERTISDAPPISFSLRVRNLGNVLARPRGPIDIVDMFGAKVGEVVVNPEAAAVFPGAERIFSATWKNDKFYFGRYQAIVSLVYGDPEARKTVSGSLSFWIVPMKKIAYVLIGLLLLITGIAWILRAYIRRRVHTLTGGATPAPEAVSQERLPFGRLLFATTMAILVALVLLFAIFFIFG